MTLTLLQKTTFNQQDLAASASLTIGSGLINGKQVQAILQLGGSVDALDGNGGEFTLTMKLGEDEVQLMETESIMVPSGATAHTWRTATIAIPDEDALGPTPLGTKIILEITSPNAADTSVDVHVWLYDMTQTGESFVGSGGTAWPLTINDSGDNPIGGAKVWITTDLAGTNVVAGILTTDDFGVVTPMLDAGDYYRWVNHSGFDFTNPQAFTVT